jgi:hypothetical protein
VLAGEGTCWRGDVLARGRAGEGTCWRGDAGPAIRAPEARPAPPPQAYAGRPGWPARDAHTGTAGRRAGCHGPRRRRLAGPRLGCGPGGAGMQRRRPGGIAGWAILIRRGEAGWGGLAIRCDLRLGVRLGPDAPPFVHTPALPLVTCPVSEVTVRFGLPSQDTRRVRGPPVLWRRGLRRAPNRRRAACSAEGDTVGSAIRV